MKTLFNSIKKSLKEYARGIKRYFSEGINEIAQENLATLRLASPIGLCCSLFFFVITPLIIPSWSVTKEYLFILPILFSFSLFSIIYSRKEGRINSNLIQGACVVFYALLLMVFIALSVFPYPATPQIFITLCFMFMPALLIQRPRTTFLIIILSEAVFLYLVFKFKTPECIEQDIFNSMASGIFSMVVSFTTTRLRIRNFEARAKLRLLNMTDSLTGILNKTSFEENCTLLMNGITGLPNCALIVMDIDDFKNVNDRYGHQIGDETLAAVGKMLRQNFRHTDLVGRIGGDEFCILMMDVFRSDLVKMKLDGIKAALTNLNLPISGLRVTASFGCAVNIESRFSYLQMFKAADEALYSSKASGKDDYTIKELHEASN